MNTVVLPVGPRRLLVWVAPDSDLTPHTQLSGAEADELADEVNARTVEQAFRWVAAEPGNDALARAPWPGPQPIISVCDGESVAGERLHKPPFPRTSRRLRRSDVAEESAGH